MAIVFDGEPELMEAIRSLIPLEGAVSVPHGSISVHFTPEAARSAQAALKGLEGRNLEIDGRHVRVRKVTEGGVECCDVDGHGRITSCVYILSWMEVRTVTVRRDA